MGITAKFSAFLFVLILCVAYLTSSDFWYSVIMSGFITAILIYVLEQSVDTRTF